jgi:hypothetical protein
MTVVATLKAICLSRKFLMSIPLIPHAMKCTVVGAVVSLRNGRLGESDFSSARSVVTSFLIDRERMTDFDECLLAAARQEFPPPLLNMPNLRVGIDFGANERVVMTYVYDDRPTTNRDQIGAEKPLTEIDQTFLDALNELQDAVLLNYEPNKDLAGR